MRHQRATDGNIDTETEEQTHRRKYGHRDNDERIQMQKTYYIEKKSVSFS